MASIAQLPRIEPSPDAGRPSLASIADGFRYVTTQPVVLGFMLVDLNAMVFGMPMALFPAIATHRFGDPTLTGYLYAAPYAGALVSSLASGWIPHVRRQGLAVVLAACGWGVAIAAFGFAESLWLSLVLLAVAGAADDVSAIFRSTIMLTATPDEMRGRLVGIEFAQVASGPTLGNTEAGLVASFTSLRFSIVSGGVLCVIGAVADGAHRPGARPLRLAAEARVSLGRAFFDRSVHEVAPELVGATLLVDGCGGTIVEVEAYHFEDPASHGFRGRTERNAVDVRAARARVRLPLLRHPLVPQLRLRAGGLGERGPDPRPRADAGA